MNRLNSFTILFLLLYFSAFSQTQVGNDIIGETIYDGSGSIVSLSGDGSILAIAAKNNDGTGIIQGHVRVYQFANNSWTQMGDDLDGEASGDYSGYSMSLSSDGSMVAIGSPYNDGDGGASYDVGHVRVFQFSNDAWVQIGNDVEGEAQDDFSSGFSGAGIKLSADGNTLAVGAISNDANGEASGHVRVYQLMNNDWQQIGNDLDGEAPDDRFGSAVSLSSNGSILAVGAPNTDNNGGNSGCVKVYHLVNNNWEQLGNAINGEAAGDESGLSAISLSADGNILAIGAKKNDGNGDEAGHVRVFQLINNNWEQKGNDIDGEAADDESGASISLSSDGSILAVGAPENDFINVIAGQVRIFQFSGDSWVQIGDDIYGKAIYDNCGATVSLSSDGSTLAVGSPGHLTSTGQARVFELAQPNIISNDQCFTVQSNPDPNVYVLEGDFSNCNIFILDQNENVLQFLLNVFNKITIDLDDLGTGLHFIRVQHQEHEALLFQDILKQ